MDSVRFIISQYASDLLCDALYRCCAFVELVFNRYGDVYVVLGGSLSACDDAAAVDGSFPGQPVHSGMVPEIDVQCTAGKYLLQGCSGEVLQGDEFQVRSSFHQLACELQAFLGIIEYGRLFVSVCLVGDKRCVNVIFQWI